MTDLSMLNQQQKTAVLESINKNVVLLAGAGSGKTKTLVTRTQYLIDDLGVKPSQIMLITFTNKAATEIQERIMQVSSEGYKMWIGTFHRICTRLLRMFGSKMGIDHFTIMEPKDAKSIIKKILIDRGIEYTPYMINDYISQISTYKNNLIKPSMLMESNQVSQLFIDLYKEYQDICWKRKSFDFDDLIIYAIMLLSSYKDVSDWVHNNIKYITLDEAQDTCSSQFSLVKLIAGDNNIMLCGDVNQSIYAFRNAKPEYLENFANTHPNTVKMKLEQNYRSTKTIINAANEVVCNNDFGTKLTMFCDNKEGELISIYTAPDPIAEAKWIAAEILASGKDLSDFAIIYRANAQSRVIEEEFIKAGVAYTVFGAKSFYARSEVKDLLSWCKSVINPNDENSFIRALTTLKGVGKTTINQVIQYARMNNVNYHQALNEIIKVPKVIKAAQLLKLRMADIIFNNQYKSCHEIINDVLFYTAYRETLASVQSVETQEKLAIIDEFVAMVQAMEENSSGVPLEEIIDQISLLAEAKGREKQNLNAVKLMTAHASKGLEFDTVFIVGSEEGIFPHTNALYSEDSSSIEEERRLYYVAMTRAKESLYITRAFTRKSNDGITQSKMSRFVEEIPFTLKEEVF